MAKNVGQRARFRDSLDRVRAQNVQLSSDMAMIMEDTQSTIEDVMKVVLANVRLTNKIVDAELLRLQHTKKAKEEALKFLKTQHDFTLWSHMADHWRALPWWKKLLHWNMRVKW